MCSSKYSMSLEELLVALELVVVLVKEVELEELVVLVEVVELVVLVVVIELVDFEVEDTPK